MNVAPGHYYDKGDEEKSGICCDFQQKQKYIYKGKNKVKILLPNTGIRGKSLSVQSSFQKILFSQRYRADMTWQFQGLNVKVFKITQKNQYSELLVILLEVKQWLGRSWNLRNEMGFWANIDKVENSDSKPPEPFFLEQTYFYSSLIITKPLRKAGSSLAQTINRRSHLIRPKLEGEEWQDSGNLNMKLFGDTYEMCGMRMLG